MVVVGDSGGLLGGDEKHKLWCHLPLLVQAGSKDSMEEVLRRLWRTRRTGLSSSDRADVRVALRVPSDSELDPLLVCLRVLIRACLAAGAAAAAAGGEANGGGVVVDVEGLIPENEVSPELRRLLGLLLQKLLREWLQDVAKEKVEAAAAAAAEGADAEPNRNAHEVVSSDQPAA